MVPPFSEIRKILLVDDEEQNLQSTKLSLQAHGFYGIVTLSDSSKTLEFLAQEPIAVILLDLRMPKVSGIELLPKIVQEYPDIPVILVTANDEIDTVVEAMKLGAFDYLVKPVEASRLVSSLRKAFEMRSMAKELSSLKQYMLSDRLDYPEVFTRIITGDKKMRALFQYIEVVAPTREPILIVGETGVGKELVAQAIHKISGCKGEFVAVNIAGLDDNMFTDTLFGHKKGAFTGAEVTRDGLIAKAGRGTLFLDEIGDMNEASQIKLLRLLQEQEYYPVGSDLVQKSDARLIMATNRNLQQLIAEGRFRNDLYYRLFAHQVNVPPLRERQEDIPLLLEHFLNAAAKNLGKKKPTVPPELAAVLSVYHFPGNIRELEALVSDAVIRHTGGVLSMKSFSAVIGDHQRSSTGHEKPVIADEDPLKTLFGHFPTIGEVEDYMVDEAMKLARGNQGLASKMLGIGRQTLNKRLKKHGYGDARKGSS
ncbi:sigma-54-dependent transcriptional regulator [Geopsychrobacter electrodiphilus]|uniref:sigma-54-dependent transcriptional regulator n=1 Tax=Geopsychrobacter electrodiphilus TaxID=225196 RepID=UPI00037EB2B1|nr:sigma-54 dependent transcriptional regulator [Geopsychrobacter electrodiphilus]